MEANFKQVEGKLYLNIQARSNLERIMLEEFMQQQISSYKHSFHYDYSKENNNLSIQFRPIISGGNLLKDGWERKNRSHNIPWYDTGKYGRWRNFGNSNQMFLKVFNGFPVLVNSFGSVWYEEPEFPNSNPVKPPRLVHKRVKDIEELRDYVRQMKPKWNVYEEY